MKIQSIETFRYTPPPPSATSPEQRRPHWGMDDEVANPMSRYPKVKRHRDSWRPPSEPIWCKVTAEDGTFGLGQTGYGAIAHIVIEKHLAPHLVGEDCLATGKLADMMFRLTKPHGTTGLASYAISAIDLALWDLKGKLLGKPVYELLGGPHKEKIFAYATGNDVDWYQELGFRAFKLACPYGPADGWDGILRNEERVARVREQVGDDCEIMLDCWMAFDVDYTVRLAERLRPYRLRWMEECLLTEDFDAHLELRRRLPWQTLTTGEHWYTHIPFQWAARHHAVDILQPDICWCGGLTTCVQIAQIADSAGISVMLHAGSDTAFGQHFSIAMPSVPWIECFVRSAPGVPMASAQTIPGVPVAENGWLTPSDAPGFGLEIPDSSLTRWT